MVIYAPYYWRPTLGQPVGMKYYFLLPTNSEKPQLVLEGSAKLFDPKQQPWKNGEILRGTIDLPPDAPGLWSFMPVDNQLVHVRNIPPFFAVEDPKNYFQPPIAWRREAIPADIKPPAKTSFVDGAAKMPGNRALYVSQPMFQFSTGKPHASGDGNQFMPRKQGTIEFWYRPSWNTIDLSPGTKNICSLIPPKSGEPYSLSYLMAPRTMDPCRCDFLASHVLCGRFLSDGSSHSQPLRAWRRTVFTANQWVHIAWVWGPRNSIAPLLDGGDGKPADGMLVTEIYVDGRKGQSRGDRWPQNLLAETPALFQIQNADAAIDELRVSDVQRYTKEFQNAPRATPSFHSTNTPGRYSISTTICTGRASAQMPQFPHRSSKFCNSSRRSKYGCTIPGSSVFTLESPPSGWRRSVSLLGSRRLI